MMLYATWIRREVSIPDNSFFSQISREAESGSEGVGKRNLRSFSSGSVRLRTHKIHHLSALYRKTIYAARIEGDLRAVFYLEGQSVISVDIGTHAIYRG
jgi:hypothetical protein